MYKPDCWVHEVDLGIFFPVPVSSERVGQHRSSDQEGARAVWATTEAPYFLSGTTHCSGRAAEGTEKQGCLDGLSCPWAELELWVTLLLLLTRSSAFMNSDVTESSYTQTPSNENDLFLFSSCTTTTRGSRRRLEMIFTVPGARWTAANSTACSNTSNSPIHASSSAMW